MEKERDGLTFTIRNPLGGASHKSLFITKHGRLVEGCQRASMALAKKTANDFDWPIRVAKSLELAKANVHRLEKQLASKRADKDIGKGLLTSWPESDLI